MTSITFAARLCPPILDCNIATFDPAEFVGKAAPSPEPREQEWTRFYIQTKAPSDERSMAGEIMEARFAVDGDMVHVQDMEGRLLGSEQFRPGDDVKAVARRILRAKRPSSFFDPIPYPYRRPN
jgi:hypothetical protein